MSSVTVNMRIHKDLKKAIMILQERLSKKEGYKVTISQTTQYIGRKILS